jgi:hypothetical protein
MNMKTNNQSLKCACSAVACASLYVAFLPQTAAGGNRVFAGPPTINAKLQSLLPIPARSCSAIGKSAVVTQAIPIKMGTPLPYILPGETFTCTVTVDSVPADGGYVQVTCDTPSALSNDSQSWPYSVYFAPGSSTTASFSLTANSVASLTTVNMYYGTSSADPNNPDDWTAGGTVTITPPLAPPPCITPRKR